MEFVHKKKRARTGDDENEIKDEESNSAENYMLRVNWLYRPKDISKHVSDSRLLYATMHSDILPLQSIRGKCTVKLRDHIVDFDEYRATPDCFWFDKLYDRYIIRFYEVVPTEKITNIPKKMYDILTSRFKYAIVEIGRGKELCETPKSCEKCSQWCSPDDSVQCAHCKGYYHMLCVDPPLTRKPTRGFGWSCAKCSGALERKLEENKGILTNRISLDAIMTAVGSVEGMQSQQNSNNFTSSANSTPSSRSPSSQPVSRYEELEVALSSEHVRKKLTKEQEHQLRLWPFRYLGVHSKMEDILDTDDRIYPRAASRLGSRHQASILDWPGRPIIYYEPEKVEKKAKKGSKPKAKVESGLTSAPPTPIEEFPSGAVTPTAIPKKDRPAWMQEKPVGYIERGGDSTSSLLWKMPDTPDGEFKLDEYLKKTEPFAEALSLAHHSPNFYDACLKAYMDSGYDDVEALKTVATFTRKSLKEPTFTPQEQKRFEDAVRKYGSELYPVYKEMKTKKSADVVRYYYLWKKTPSGHEIWDNYEGRKGNKKKQNVQTTDDGLVDEVADSSDDSAYDNEKIKQHNRSMCCKYCLTTTSQAWRRAPGHPVAGNEDPITALCIRCARLWKKYAVQWENPEDVMRKVLQKSGNGAKRKVEEELITDAKSILNERDKELDRNRKKIKLDKPKEKVSSQTPTPVPKERKRPLVSSAEESNQSKAETKQSKVEPKQSKTEPKQSKAEPKQSKAPKVRTTKSGSESAQISSDSTPATEEDVTESNDLDELLPSPPPKKKRNRSKKKENQFIFMKVQTPDAFGDSSKASQISRPCAVCGKVDPVVEQLFCQSCALNVHYDCYGGEKSKIHSAWLCDPCSNDQKPYISNTYGCLLCPVRDVIFYDDPNTISKTFSPPDTVKRTFDNNWAHIRCSMFIPEVKFGDPKTLQPVVDINKIPEEKFKETCVLCGSKSGACTTCALCPTSFHVGCAYRNHFNFGFDFQPVKGGRKGAVKTVKFGDKTGVMVASIVCQDHSSTELISMDERDPVTGRSALEIYNECYKLSDNKLTGAMRRAALYPLKASSKATCIEPPETASATNLALVLSPFRDLYNSGFPRELVKCEHCGYSRADFWIETRNDDSEGKIDCPSCFWKKKDYEAFKEAFSYEKISVADNEVSNRNISAIEMLNKKNEVNGNGVNGEVIETEGDQTEDNENEEVGKRREDKGSGDVKEKEADQSHEDRESDLMDVDEESGNENLEVDPNKEDIDKDYENKNIPEEKNVEYENSHAHNHQHNSDTPQLDDENPSSLDNHNLASDS